MVGARRIGDTEFMEMLRRHPCDSVFDDDIIYVSSDSDDVIEVVGLHASINDAIFRTGLRVRDLIL